MDEHIPAEYCDVNVCCSQQQISSNAFIHMKMIFYINSSADEKLYTFLIEDEFWEHINGNKDPSLTHKTEDTPKVDIY